MEELIIVAGANKLEIGWLRRCLREHGYRSIPCKTAKQIAEELEILPTCNASVALVIIEPKILKDLNDDLILQLSEYAPEVPFLLFNDVNVQSDLMDVFEKICKYRIQFRPEQNLKLAEILWESGVEVARS